MKSAEFVFLLSDGIKSTESPFKHFIKYASEVEPRTEGLAAQDTIHPRACPWPSGAWVKLKK